MDSELWLPVSAGLQGLGQPQPSVPMEQEQDCWGDSVWCQLGHTQGLFALQEQRRLEGTIPASVPVCGGHLQFQQLGTEQ